MFLKACSNLLGTEEPHCPGGWSQDLLVFVFIFVFVFVFVINQMSWRACTNALGRLQQDSQDCFFFKGFPIPPKGQLCVTQSLTPSLSQAYPNLTLLPPWVTQSLFRCYPRPAQRLPQENPRVGEPNPNIAMDWSHHCHLQYRGPIAPSKHPHLGEKVSDFFLFTTPYLGGCPRL